MRDASAHRFPNPFRSANISDEERLRTLILRTDRKTLAMANLSSRTDRQKRGQAKRAQTLDDSEFERLFASVMVNSRTPESDELKLLLSYRAGLRAREIATLTLDHVTTPDGRINKMIWISGENSKSKRSREIPMHPHIREALIRYRKRYPHNRYIAISTANPTGPLSDNTVCVWFWRAYRRAGLTGCSSHSGRRSFATQLAQRANRFHSSLVDVQKLVGHARLETTEAYLAPSEDTHALIASLGTEPSEEFAFGKPKPDSYDW